MTTEQAGPATTTPARAGRREWIALLVLALPALLVSLDMFVLLLAMPYLSADLGASSIEQLWILDVYGFLLASLMLTMGTLGDRIGRRRLLLLGASGFAVASVLAAFAVSPLMLIVARGLLGVAGATLAPSTLALITNLFRDPAQRAQAIGIWLVCFMGGAAIGPLVGGAMLESFWWGAAFLLGVPAMLLLLVLGPILLPEHRDTAAGRIDLTSVALSLAAMLPAVYGLKELARGGWQAVPALALVVGLTTGVAFVRRQLHLEDPLVDLRLFRNRAFSTAVAGMHIITITGVTMYFVTQHLQLVEGLAPLVAGLVMLPGVLASVTSFVMAPVLARRIRPAPLIATGLVVATAGVVVLTRVEPGSLVLLAVGYVLFQLGCGPMVTLSTDIVVGSAPPERAGSAAATSESVSELGYSLGIATLGTVAAVVYGRVIEIPAALAPAAEAQARESLTGAITAARELRPGLADSLVGAARDAFMLGADVALWIVAGLLGGLAAVVLRMLRHLPPSRPAPHEATGDHTADGAGASPSDEIHPTETVPALVPDARREDS
ncbi:MFS transporter [Georgenia halophila]|uniref:MFS transporter n=1 Tax=Georgenia halophila TaxID=620889 RepID=A0ABP8LI94_9MICO